MTNQEKGAKMVKSEKEADIMKRLAESDYLTGLPNRRGLYEYYEALPRNQNVHAMFIDVDNFKRVNDLHGHSVGDTLLIQIARLVKEHTQGFASRIGGDEYVVLFDESYNREQLEQIARKMLDSMQTADFRKDILSMVSLSIGIVMSQSTALNLDDILFMCDAAMYQAKNNGKNCYAVYEAFDKKIEIRRNIEMEMKGALERGEFQVYLQPKVNMVSSAFCGAEALSRWLHPVEGLRTPDAYIPVFEKNGFIVKLDLYMFEEVCRLKASWRGECYEHIPISVNMSRLHLYDMAFAETLLAIANKYEIPPQELEIEITESVFIKDNNELVNMTNKLREKGFLVSIDDFGSGFSALNLLKDIPVNTIKLDKSFLQSSSNDVRGRKVIKNVIAMCRDLKLDVVSEGIETQEQIDFITSCGCQIAQGFFYAKPLTLSDFIVFAEEYLANTLESYVFRLNGDLKSEDGSLEGIISGEGLHYEAGIIAGRKSLYFPGGDTEQNTVHIPPKAIVNDSFTVSMWLKPKVNHQWVSALYIKFESGFCSIMPLAWEGNSDFRIRDSKEVNGWYDVSGCQLRENEWVHYVISYNARTERAVAFVNGEVVGLLDNVPTNRYVKWIILGGDVFQPSFIGNICELVIYNEPKDYDFVQALHQSYVQTEGFNAFKLGE